MIRHVTMLLMTAGLAAACAGTPDAGPDDKAATTDASSEAKYQVKEDAPRITALSERNLEAGQCGMLLWTLDDGEPVMIFRNVSGKSAEMVIDGEKQKLDLVEETGERRFGVSARQQYTIEPDTPGETLVRVDATFGLPFDGGVYIEEGVISLRNFFGWERVTPVAGLAGCRA